MIALCASDPCAETQGERIRITIPSGKDDLQVSISMGQAMLLAYDLNRRATEAFAAVEDRAAAQVLAFRPKTRTRQRI